MQNTEYTPDLASIDLALARIACNGMDVDDSVLRAAADKASSATITLDPVLRDADNPPEISQFYRVTIGGIEESVWAGIETTGIPDSPESALPGDTRLAEVKNNPTKIAALLLAEQALFNGYHAV